MSRSEFFARAAESYLDRLDSSAITRQIDIVLTDLGDDDSLVDAVAAGRSLLAATGDDW